MVRASACACAVVNLRSARSDDDHLVLSLLKQRAREQRIGFVRRVLEVQRLSNLGLRRPRIATFQQRFPEEKSRLRAVRRRLQRVLELDDRGVVVVLFQIRPRRCDQGRWIVATAAAERQGNNHDGQGAGESSSVSTFGFFQSASRESGAAGLLRGRTDA